MWHSLAAADILRSWLDQIDLDKARTCWSSTEQASATLAKGDLRRAVGLLRRSSPLLDPHLNGTPVAPEGKNCWASPHSIQV